MQEYRHLLKQIKLNGTDKSDRTGTGTHSIFVTRFGLILQEDLNWLLLNAS